MIKAQLNSFETLPVTEASEKIGLFGGSFNPPHEGHVLVAETALACLALDQIWWMVTPGNPLKKEVSLLPLKERVAQSLEIVQDARIHVTAFEEAIKSHFFLQSLKYIKQQRQGHFVLIIGADNLKNFHLWKGWQEIVHTLPIAVVDRPFVNQQLQNCPFIEKFKNFSIKEKEAASLAYQQAPVWCYIHGALSFQSSTAIRQSWKNNKG